MRHEPLKNQIEHNHGKLRAPKTGVRTSSGGDDDEEVPDDFESEPTNTKKGNKVQGKISQIDDEWEDTLDDAEDDDQGGNVDYDVDEDEDNSPEEAFDDEDIVEFDGDNIAAAGFSESEVIYFLSCFEMSLTSLILAGSCDSKFPPS